jgi:hypothetical protein
VHKRTISAVNRVEFVSLHVISNDNGVRVVNLPYPKISQSKYDVPT